MVVSLFSVAVNFVTASLDGADSPAGHAGLALATSAVSIASFLLLLFVLQRKVGSVDDGLMFSTFRKTCVASGVMGCLCYTSSGVIHQWLGMRHTAAFWWT